MFLKNFEINKLETRSPFILIRHLDLEKIYWLQIGERDRQINLKKAIAFRLDSNKNSD